MTVASLTEGRLFVTLGLPWPPADTLLLEQAVDGGRVAVLQRADARLAVHLYEGGPAGSKLRSEALSCPVVCDTDNRLILMAGWQRGQVATICGTGEFLFSADGSAQVLQELVLRAKATSSQPVEDCSTVSAQAQANRRVRLAAFTPSAKRVFGGEDYAFDALQAEVDQLEDLIPQVKAGKKHHVRGIMARVRALLIGDRPLGLLQLCAAFLDAPLTVFTGPQPSLQLPLVPGGMISFDGRATPGDWLENPIDMDAWLDLVSAIYRGKEYVNRELIRDIGNTVASHLDIDIKHSVVFLRSGGSGLTEPKDNIDRYCLMVAEMVLHLAKGLLHLRSER